MEAGIRDGSSKDLLSGAISLAAMEGSTISPGFGCYFSCRYGSVLRDPWDEEPA